MRRQPPAERPVRRVLDDAEARRLLTVLDDERCTALLEELADAEQPLTVDALSQRCGIPLSTVYRKIDDLDEVALVDQHTELREDGKHTSSYTTSLEHVDVDLTDDGLRITVRYEDGETETEGAAGDPNEPIPVRQ